MRIADAQSGKVQQSSAVVQVPLGGRVAGRFCQVDVSNVNVWVGSVKLTGAGGLGSGESQPEAASIATIAVAPTTSFTRRA